VTKVFLFFDGFIYCTNSTLEVFIGRKYFNEAVLFFKKIDPYVKFKNIKYTNKIKKPFIFFLRSKQLKIQTPFINTLTNKLIQLPTTEFKIVKKNYISELIKTRQMMDLNDFIKNYNIRNIF